MKVLKILIVLLAVAGIVGVFLPFLEMGGKTFKLWDAEGDDAAKKFMALGGFALAALGGLFAMVKGGLARWHSIVALIGFAVAILVKEVREGLMGYQMPEGIKLDTQIGGKIMFVAAAAGALVALVGLIKPER